MEQLYLNHLPLLKHRASYFASRAPYLEYEDLFSVANELFVRAYHKHNTNLSRFSHYLKLTLDFNLSKHVYSYIDDYNKFDFLPFDTICEIVGNFYKHADDYIRQLIEDETLKQFNCEHQLIFNFIFNPTPAQLKFIRVTRGESRPWRAPETVKLTKNNIVQFLKSEGWTNAKIKTSFYEINKLLFN